MDYVANKKRQVAEMLKALGISSVEELFSDIPADLRVARPQHEDGVSEFEAQQHFERLGQRNTHLALDSYLGAGAYEHHVPALVGAICSKSEFLTAYTPYQPEASQGMLQAIFEFQSAICALTGMCASNASVYDGANACAEAVLMGLRATRGKRKKILLDGALHPHYRAVVELYVGSLDVEIVELPLSNDGDLDMQALDSHLDDSVATLLLQRPNFFGVVSDVGPVFAKARELGIVNILCANPLAYGIYASAAELGADIAVGDTQPFGVATQYGGPYVGYMACRQQFVRQMPGRIVGTTQDTEGRPGYVLTLQAREQHIRREKATSNICTNQALAMLASLVAMIWYGKEGTQKLALTNFQRASYLRQALAKVPGVKVQPDQMIFNEFVVTLDQPAEQVANVCRELGIEPGLPLGRYWPDKQNALLVAVTETKNRQQIDRYVDVLAKVMEMEVVA